MIRGKAIDREAAKKTPCANTRLHFAVFKTLFF